MGLNKEAVFLVTVIGWLAVTALIRWEHLSHLWNKKRQFMTFSRHLCGTVFQFNRDSAFIHPYLFIEKG